MTEFTIKLMRPSFCLLLLVGCVLLTPLATRADTVVFVGVSTSSLAGGTFYVNFQLNDGDGAVNNTATLDDFTFGGGAAGAAATIQVTGSAAGSLNSGAVTLTDANFFNSFVQAFTPGATLGFRLTLAAPGFAGGIPDSFSFAILNESFVEIATLDPTGQNRILFIDINSANPTITQYDLQAAAPVPEPATLILLGTGLTGIVAARRRRTTAGE